MNILLKNLILSGIRRKNLITEEMFRNLFTNIPNLENVNLYNCYTVTDRVIDEIMTSFKEIKII